MHVGSEATEGAPVAHGAAPSSLPQSLPFVRASKNLLSEISGPQFTGFNPRLWGKLVVTPETTPPAIEQYRRLAATLHHLQVERDVKTIMVTSAVPDEGKTLTAANIALTLSESYRRRVLLIDADLRRPSMYNVFQLPHIAGLSDWLKAPIERPLATVRISDCLAFLPAGRPDQDPMSGLTSDRMRHLLKDARAMFDWIIVDTPPVGLLPDANLLVTMVDGAILVIRAEATPYELVQRAVQALGDDRLIGAVLNQTNEGLGGRHYGYDGYYYGYGRSARAKVEAGSELTGR
jgi:capsular exopolysaccharide synthesis family protein